MPLKGSCVSDSDDDVSFSDGFDDGTTAKTEFARFITPNDKRHVYGAQPGESRLPKQVALPSAISNTSIAQSDDYFGVGRCTTSARRKYVTSKVEESVSGSSDASFSEDGDSEAYISEASDDASTEDTYEDIDQSSVPPDVARSNRKLKGTFEPAAFGLSDDGFLEKKLKLEDEIEKEQTILQKKDLEEQQRLRQTSEHVRNQMSVWSSLLASRIHIQQMLGKINQLPLLPLKACQNEALQETRSSVAKLLVHFRHIHRTLIQRNPSLVAYVTSAADVAASDNDSNEDSELLKVKRRRDRKDLVNANAAECQENKVWEIVDAFPKRLKKWNLDVADEWHSKTLIAFKQQLKVFDQSPSAQVSRAMDGELARLLERALIIQNQASDGGSNEPLETYEDTDFYVGLLRDTISAAGQHSLETEIARESVAAQAFAKKLKQKDAAQWRRQVERRASKGRKIRYTPIPQLVGFMSAQPQDAFQESSESLNIMNAQQNNVVNILISQLFRQTE